MKATRKSEAGYGGSWRRKQPPRFSQRLETHSGAWGAFKWLYVSQSPRPVTCGQSYWGHTAVSLVPRGQDPLFGRKPVFPLSRAIPTAAHMVGREAAFAPGSRSAGKSSVYLAGDVHVDAQDGFASANVCSNPSSQELRPLSLSQEAVSVGEQTL